ncbi:MAG: ABC transporter permease [bacterium]|nr:ABC transporter permease [bacterium]
MTAAPAPAAPNPSARSSGTTTPLTSRISAALRNGWALAKVELLVSVRGADWISYLITPVIALAVILFTGGSEIGSTGISVAQYIVPSLIGMTIAVGGLMSPPAILMMEREDGSMVRMKAVPGGLQGYVLGKVLMLLITNVASLLLVFAVMAIAMPELLPDGPGAWLRFVLFVVLGLLATLPAGIAIGTMMRNAALLMIPMFAVYGVIFISGIFYPMEALATPLQWIGMAFPMYWMGMGLRSAFLPPEAAGIELAGSWQTLESVAVLGIWAVAGLVLAPILMRRMIRGVSGSTVIEARERMLSRGY